MRRLRVRAGRHPHGGHRNDQHATTDAGAQHANANSNSDPATHSYTGADANGDA